METQANNPLLLRNLPKYRCCGHCMPKYCPDGTGHYAKCPIKTCIQGLELEPKKVVND